MYTAPESFYRDEAGDITTEPRSPSGESREMVASCGAVMSKQEARDRGLLPQEQPLQPEPADPNASESPT